MILLLVSVLVPACLFYAVVLVNFQREVAKGRQKFSRTRNVISFNSATRQGDAGEVCQLESAYFGPFLIVPLRKSGVGSAPVESRDWLARARP